MIQSKRLMLSLVILLDLGATLALAVPPIPDDGFVLAMAAADPPPAARSPLRIRPLGGPA